VLLLVRGCCVYAVQTTAVWLLLLQGHGEGGAAAVAVGDAGSLLLLLLLCACAWGCWWVGMLERSCARPAARRRVVFLF
jgi:hypothetical protein